MYLFWLKGTNFEHHFLQEKSVLWKFLIADIVSVQWVVVTVELEIFKCADANTVKWTKISCLPSLTVKWPTFAYAKTPLEIYVIYLGNQEFTTDLRCAV
jgi:hypothetical protein